MTSFATDEPTRALPRRPRRASRSCSRSSCRCDSESDGDLFREADGRPSLYGPGTATCSTRSARSGTLDELACAGRPVTCSLQRRQPRRENRPGRRRRARARRAAVDHRDRPQRGRHGRRARARRRPPDAARGARFPAGFDQSRIPRLQHEHRVALGRGARPAPYELTWFYVREDVDGRTAVQLERLYHEISGSLRRRFSSCRVRGPVGGSSRSRRRTTSRPHGPRLREMLADHRSTEPSGRQRRYEVVTNRQHRRQLGAWLLDLVLPPRCAVCARFGTRFAPPASPRSCGSGRRSASAAGRPVRGPYDAAPSAPAGGSHSRLRGPLSSTTIARVLSSAVEGARAPRPRRRRRRDRRRGLAARRVGTHVTFRPTRPAPPARTRPRPKRLARALGRRWKLPVARLLAADER